MILRTAPRSFNSQLYDSQDQPIVTYTSNQHFFHSDAPTLEVRQDAMGFLELVIMGWIITQREIEIRKKKNDENRLKNEGTVFNL